MGNQIIMNQNSNGSNNGERAQGVRESGDGSNPPREIHNFAPPYYEMESTNEEFRFEDEEDASAFPDINRFTYAKRILPLKHKMSPEFRCGFGDFLTESGQERIGLFLARATHLKDVGFYHPHASFFSRVLSGPFEDHNLEYLAFHGSLSFLRPLTLYDDDLTCIGNYVERAHSLKDFKLESFEVGAAGTEIVSNALNRARPIRLVFKNMLPERGALRALLSPQFTRSLIYLDLSGCPLERDAYELLVEILSDKNANLSELDLAGVRVGDTFARMLCHALEDNETLKSLRLDFPKISNDSRKFFQKLLFNDSGLDGVYDSNHTIDLFSWKRGINFLGSLGPVARINRAVCSGEGRRIASSDNIALRRRKKIVKYLRLGNSFNATPFHALDLEILPHALQFVGKLCPVELSNHMDAFFKVDDMYHIIISADVDHIFGK